MVDLRGRKLFCAEYWMRVKHVDETTVTYDSFKTTSDGKIVTIGRDFKRSLSNVIWDIENGHLQIE